MMYEESLFEKFNIPRRLHPASIIIDFTRIIKETIFGFGIGLILTLKESFFYFIIFVTVFLLALIIYSILSWLRFTYYVEGDELRIEQGVIVRKKRFISKHRIHKIDVTANIVHRLFKLVEVQVDTASNSGGAEVYLSAVPLREAGQLRAILQQNKKEETEQTNTEEPINQKITWRRLFIAGSTSGSAGVIILAVLTLFSQVEELIPQSVFNTVFDWLVNLGMVFLVVFIVFLLFLLWLFGIAGTMIRYGNFIIQKRENELFIKRGLLETKELTIPFQRIQAIGIEQSIIRQPFGFVRVFAVVAGGSFDKLETFPVLFPIMRESEVHQFIDTFLPEYAGHLDGTFQRLPRRSLKFYLGKSCILPMLLFIPVIVFFPKLLLVPIVITVLSITYGYFQYKDVGYYSNNQYFVFQIRRLQKTLVITNKNRIQALEKKQHKLQALQNLATLRISLIGSAGLGTHYKLKHVDDEEANKVADWYSYRAIEEDLHATTHIDTEREHQTYSEPTEEQ